MADIVQLLHHPVRHGARRGIEQTVDRHAVGVRHAGDIICRLCPALDLDGIDAGFMQLLQIGQQAEILCIEDIAAVGILIDRKILSRPLFLHERIFPAAGLRTGAAVRVASGEILREQTAAGDAHAHRAVNKDLDLQLRRRFCTDLRDLRYRKLPRKYDALYAHLIQRRSRLIIDHARLRRSMDLQLRRKGACHCNHAEIGGNDSVNAARPDLFKELRIGSDLRAARQDVRGEIHPDTLRVCKPDCLPQCGKIKVFCGGAHSVFLRADIDRIRAELQRGGKAFGIACGGEQLRLKSGHLLLPLPRHTVPEPARGSPHALRGCARRMSRRCRYSH